MTPDTTNWRERFDKEFAGINRGGFEYPAQHEIKSFIQTLLTEQARAIIDEIPNTEHAEFCKARGDQYWPCAYCFKQQLKSKYHV